ncbi:MAG: hypothetical protein ABEJ34_04165, partial [Haloferacaceae archaeon]
PAERRKLFADAVAAHRERGSRFLTVELDPSAVGDDGETTDPDGDADVEDQPVPWIQFADRTFNLDCTDEELDRLDALLEEFPEFRIDAMESPEEAEGTNVRISARSDANRLAAFVDRAFESVYGAPDGYRAWVVRV